MAETYIDVLRSGNEPDGEEFGEADALHADLLASTASTTSIGHANGRSERSPLVGANGGSKAADGTTGKVYVLLEGARRGLSAIAPSEKSRDRLRHIKVGILFLMVIIATFVFGAYEEDQHTTHYEAVSEAKPAVSYIALDHPHAILECKFTGPFIPRVRTNEITNLTKTINVAIFGVLKDEPSSSAFVVSTNVTLYLEHNRHFRNRSALEIIEHDFDVHDHEYSELYFHFQSGDPETLAFGLKYDALPASAKYQVVYAGIILLFVYVLIIFEMVHRTVAAMVGSLLALMTLSILNKRPTLEQTVEWIDYETIGLLFGMMTLVGIFSNTGVFDWLALKAYKLAKGRIWPLITILCFFSGIISAFLDNVTTILLLTPVSIRLCQVLNLDPTRVLMAEVVFSNIGGTATAVGDPPNVIIVSNKDIAAAGITFATFTLHMCIGIVFCMFGAYGLLRLMYRKIDLTNEDPPDVAELKREVRVWKRTASRVPMVSAEQKAVRALLMQKMLETEQRLRDLRVTHGRSSERWRQNLKELEQKYRITDYPLLIKSMCVLVVTVTFFFAHSAPTIHMGLGWIALLAGVWLLVLADVHDLENMLEKIEWATLLFFAALFVLMEALGELGLIKFLGNETSALIQSVPEQSRLTVAIITILWLSAIASSFIDNIPFTTAMIPVVVALGNDPDVNLPLPPLVWALAMGACLGGNGTLIGASANVVCAGIAEQHGYPISFNMFFKIGFPMMLVTNAIAMVYLLICHSALNWNSP